MQEKQEKSKKSYEIIIIGAGMAGLYTAFLLKQNDPNINLLMIEQNAKQHVGGRANTVNFYDTKIPIGAGIGRQKKDKILAHLMRYYRTKGLDKVFNIHSYNVEHNIATTTNINVPLTMRRLKQEYEKHITKMKEHPQTFRQFALHVLGNTDYNRFTNSTGFTDYENEDAYETIYEYGMEDNLGGWKAFSVPWHDLVQQLMNSVGTSNFVFGKKALHISKSNDTFEVKTQSTMTNHVKSYYAKKVVVATTIDTLRHLFPTHTIYREIEPQPFLRVYGKFDKQSVGIMKEVVPKFTYVDFPIQKIIPMNTEKGVYMIVYNDNASALKDL
jgi:protoporphyrinogen oxidase